VSVNLLRDLLQRARAADEGRYAQDESDRHPAEDRERAQHGERQRHDGVGAAEQDEAVPPIGEHASRQSDDQQRRHAEGERHADHERGVRELEGEPAEDDLLAREGDRVE
jgi:hypothetical protein